MRAWLGVLFGLLLVSPAFAREEDEEPDNDLPEGDAPSEEEEEPPEKPPSEDPTIEPRLLVLVIGEPEETATAQRIGDEATRKLAAIRKLEPMTALHALDPTAEDTKRDEIAMGRETVRAGLLSFAELDLQVAGEKLESGIDALAAYFGELPEDARRSLSEAIFAYAATTLFEGQTDQADLVFVALAVLDPDFAAEQGRYPSNVLDRFSSVKSGIDARPTGSLTVKAHPAGAAVHIDGLYRGSSPVTVSGLADGYHVVSVRRIGFRPLGTLTPVNADGVASVDLELDRSRDVSRLSLFERETFKSARAAADLARAIGAKEIAVLDFARRLPGTFVEGILVASDGRLIVKLPPTDIPADPERAGKTIADAFVRAEEEAIRLANQLPPEEITPFYEEWWFWAAVGGAVAVIATSAAVAATTGDGGPPNNTAIFGF